MATAGRLTRRALLAASAVSLASAAVGRSAWGGEAAAPAAGFRLDEQPGGRLQVLEGDKPVLTYNWGDQLKAGVPENRKRSCYVHPVWGMDGEVLTDDFPADHHHHRGLSWMWNRVKVGGRELDLWTIRGIRQHFVRWLQKRADASGAVLEVENAWLVGEEPVAKETVGLFLGRAQPAGRAADVAISLESLGDPIELRGEITKGYGGLCLRFAPREETVITTPAGNQAKDSDHLKFPWADLSARFAGRREPSGAALFIPTANPGAPNEWTLRHYGFLGPCWPGMESFTLERGKPVMIRYRVWVHRGGAAEGKVAEAYKDYLPELKVRTP